MHSSTAAHPSVVIPRPLRTELGRSDLLTRLSNPDTEITALLAPSGYGKTTLLAQHARALQRPTLWLSLSHSDSEVDFFLASLTRAAAQLNPDTVPTAASTPERTADLLATHITQSWPDLTLYIDRTELLSPLTGQLLTLFLDRFRTHQVLLSGTVMDALPLARWTAAGQVTVLGSAHLAFNQLETEAFLRARNAPLDTQESVAALEGWPAGVALAASGAHNTLDPGDLMREALNVLPAPLRTVLPEASVLSEWHDDLIQDLDLPLPSGWLDALRRAGLPLTPLGRGWYRPHGLLLSTLDAELRRTPARFQALHALQASRLAPTDPLRALHHAGQAQHQTLTLELAATVLPRLRERSEFALMHATLGALHLPDPPAWWQEYHAVAQIEVGQTAAGEQQLRALHEQGLTTAVGFTALTLLATRRGDFQEQLRLAELGLALFPPEETRALTLQRAVALISLGQVHEGLAVCEQAAAQAAARGAPLEEAAALTMGQYAYQMLGRWPERNRAVERARKLLEEQRQEARTVPLLNILADEALLAGEVDVASAHIEQAIQIAARRTPIMTAQLLLTRAQIQVQRRELGHALAILDEALSAAAQMGLAVLRPFALLARFDILNHQGERGAAETAYQEAAGLLSELGRRQQLPFYTGLRAWSQGDWAAARQAFEQAASVPGRLSPARASLYLLDLKRRSMTLDPADTERARDLTDMRSLAAFALDQPVLQALADALAPLAPDHPLAALSRSPQQEDGMTVVPAVTLGSSATAELSIQVLGQLRIQVSGQAVRMPLAKSMEVLAWLAWHGAGSSAEIMSDLWGGSRERKHHEYFRVAVRKLRAALTQAGQWSFDPVPYDGQRYRFHPNLHVHLDARELTRHVAAGNLSGALDVYAGEPLPGLDGEWARSLREQLRTDLLDAVLDMARTQPGAHTLQLLRRAAQFEPVHEQLNVTLIEELLLRQPADALSAFRTYASQLRTLLDEEVPEQLRRQLMGKGLSLS